MDQNTKIGLVLSGGGTKGAYQAGVYKAMEELGLIPHIKAIAGTSIGSFNALLFSCGTLRYGGSFCFMENHYVFYAFAVCGSQVPSGQFVQPNEKQGIQNTDRGHAGGKRFARAFNAAQSKRIGPPHA